MAATQNDVTNHESLAPTRVCCAAQLIQQPSSTKGQAINANNSNTPTSHTYLTERFVLIIADG